MQTYHEPMLGGGALFIRLLESGQIRSGARLSDSNIYLMRAWQGVLCSPHAVVVELQNHAAMHCGPYFLEQRSRQIEMLASLDSEAAGWFLYINRASFNGLWRIASDGRLNSSWGKRTQSAIVADLDDVLELSQSMQDAGIRIEDFSVLDVQTRLDRVAPGDVAYVDPPYVGTFSRYTNAGFSPERHEGLAQQCAEVARRGARVLVSQSAIAAPIYDPHLLSVKGAKKVELNAYRSVSQDAATRGKTRELLYVLGGE
jgi:DNA adenine methylase